MRTYVLTLLAVACLGLSACGSDESTHDVAPSSVPKLEAPQGSAALAKPADSTSSDQSGTTSTDANQSQDQSSSSGDTGDGTAQGGATPDATAQGGTGTGSGGTGSGTGGTGSGDSAGGTDTDGDSGTGGTSPGEFNQFCQDNPGACPGN
jgi:hypothetical protein